MSICAPGGGVGAPLSCNIPGGLGVLDGAHGLGVGLGKLVRVGLGRLLAEGGDIRTFSVFLHVARFPCSFGSIFVGKPIFSWSF